MLPGNFGAPPKPPCSASKVCLRWSEADVNTPSTTRSRGERSAEFSSRKAMTLSACPDTMSGSFR